MSTSTIEKARNIMQFKKQNLKQGIIEIDHLYLDFSNKNQNECFIQNYAKQILHNQIWFTGVKFKLTGKNEMRTFIFDNYPEIAHQIASLDPLAIDHYLNSNFSNETLIHSSWLKTANPNLAVQLYKVSMGNVTEPFIK
ncbi:hypothetical protein ACWCL1_07030 [Ligilactobacillus sp. LYQ135]